MDYRLNYIHKASLIATNIKIALLSSIDTFLFLKFSYHLLQSIMIGCTQPLIKKGGSGKELQYQPTIKQSMNLKLY
jgi:hypothetical protein